MLPNENNPKPSYFVRSRRVRGENGVRAAVDYTKEGFGTDKPSTKVYLPEVLLLGLSEHPFAQLRAS